MFDVALQTKFVRYGSKISVVTGEDLSLATAKENPEWFSHILGSNKTQTQSMGHDGSFSFVYLVGNSAIGSIVHTMRKGLSPTAYSIRYTSPSESPTE